MKPKRLAVWLVPAAVFVFLYCASLDRPGLLSDEEFVRLADRGWDALMASPYTGGLKPALFAGLSRVFPPGLLLVRGLSAAVAGLLFVSIAALGSELGGWPCGLAAALLALCDPNVFWTVRHDNSGGGLAVAFLCAGAALLLRWKRGGGGAAALLGGFCAGLALWSHLLTCVPLAAAAAALSADLWRRRDRLRLAAAGLLLGASPLVLYYAHYGAAPLLGYFTVRGASQWTPLPARWAVLASRLNGLWAAWAAGLAVQWLLPSRPRAALWLTPALSGAMLCLVPIFGSPHHVLIALCPWVFLPAAALAADALGPDLPSWKRAAGVFPAALWLGLSLPATLRARRAILEDDVRPEWSRQVQADFRRSLLARSETVVPVNRVPDISILTEGRLPMDASLIDWLRPNSPERAVPVWLDSELRRPDVLYASVCDAPEREQLRWEKFLLLAGSRGLTPEPVEIIARARDGAPAIELWRLEPLKRRR